MKQGQERWGWQRDPRAIKTERVQLWRNGIMLAVITRKEAQETVREGRAFVICSQAIGNYDK